MNTSGFARTRGPVLVAAAFAALSLAACNQPAQTTAAAPIAALPAAPIPPPVPQSSRAPQDVERWQRYMALKAAYEEQVARARSEGRQEQAAADAGQQGNAFNAGRQVQAHVDQGRIDQARRNLDQVTEQAKAQPDPHRRDQMINQARADLAAAMQGH